jgi:hypothetical protein
VIILLDPYLLFVHNTNQDHPHTLPYSYKRIQEPYNRAKNQNYNTYNIDETGFLLAFVALGSGGKNLSIF